MKNIVKTEPRLAPTLQYGVGVQDLLLYPGVFPTDGRQVLEDQLGALRLPGPGLSTDDDALVLSDKAREESQQDHWLATD